MTAAPTAIPQIFDRQLVRRRRQRAALAIDDHDFLFREAALRLLDRLDDIRRPFFRALDLGARHGLLGSLGAGRGGIAWLVACDPSSAMARRHLAPSLVVDEETLPFAPASFDLILSNLTLHAVNDLPGVLVQGRQTLRPGGLFLASLLGGKSLTELREVLLEAESELEGGASPRVAPMAELAELSGLLRRAGFVDPVVDSDRLTVRYAEPLRLLDDLRGMGESNALVARRRRFLRRTTLARALALYRERYGDAEGRVPATFEIFTLTGWVGG
ncbi:MAG: methyltransferase domain-containing protein [Rhodospirillales bacterium]|nr:methyltransferase domain-containing protein [Rhodospirillales bacterium]